MLFEHKKISTIYPTQEKNTSWLKATFWNERRKLCKIMIQSENLKTTFWKLHLCLAQKRNCT